MREEPTAASSRPEADAGCAGPGPDATATRVAVSAGKRGVKEARRPLGKADGASGAPLASIQNITVGVANSALQAQNRSPDLVNVGSW